LNLDYGGPADPDLTAWRGDKHQLCNAWMTSAWAHRRIHAVAGHQSWGSRRSGPTICRLCKGFRAWTVSGIPEALYF